MNGHRLTKQIFAAALAACLTAVLGACGKDRDPEAATTTTESSSSEEYVAAGNALCDQTNSEVQAAFPDFEGEPTIPEVQKLGRDLSPVLTRFRDGVAALTPPADSADKHQELLEALQRSISKLDAAAASTEGAQALLDAGGPPLDEPGNAAHALFERCPAGD